MANAHSLFRFAGLRFWGLGNDLYRDGIIISSVFDGTRLSFARMPPSIDPDVGATNIRDYLFVAGGGVLQKVDPLGGVTAWGIDEPVDGFTATVGVAGTVTVDDFDDSSTWSGSSASLANEGTIKIAGTNSMKMTVSKRTTGTATKSVTLNLGTVGGVASTDGDFISLWVRLNRPERVDSIQLQFSLGGTGFANDMYSKSILVENKKKSKQQKGVAALPEVADTQTGFVTDSVNGAISPEESDNLTIKAADTTMTFETDSWTKISIPLVGFQRAGANTALSWANVQAVRIVLKTNSRGSVDAYFDAGQLTGGSGLQGRYRYHITYRNDTTGHRSNPNLTPVTVLNVQRSVVTLANFPSPPDPQVSHIEIWRTIGDGSFFFLINKITVGTSTFLDDYADFDGMASGGGNVIGSEILLFDNNKPFSTLEFCLAPHVGRMWWCGDLQCGNSGRVYYSGTGRPEAMSSFIDVTDADDQTVCLVVWNGSIYCFADSGIFEILGTDEPFIPRRIFGCPGIKRDAAHSAKPTPHGIAYQSHDGVRMFDGNFAKLLSFEAVNKIMRGESSEGIAPFSGEVATYARDEYFVADPGNVTLACNLEEGRWRNCGIDANALHYQDDTGDVIGAYNDKILGFEVPTELDDDGDAIPFEAETPATLLAVGQKIRVGNVIVDVDTQNEQLTATLVLDRQTYLLGLVQTTTRAKVELPVHQSGLVASLRLTGDLHNIVEIFHVEAELSVEGQKAKKELFEPTTPYTGLWNGYGNDITPRFGLRRNKSVHTLRTQTIRSRPGSKILGADQPPECIEPGSAATCCGPPLLSFPDDGRFA